MKLLIDIDESTLGRIREEHDLKSHYPRDTTTGAPECAVRLIAEAEPLVEPPHKAEHSQELRNLVHKIIKESEEAHIALIGSGLAGILTGEIGSDLEEGEEKLLHERMQVLRQRADELLAKIV